MKLATYIEHGREKVGVVSEDQMYICPISAYGLPYTSMNELIEKITDEELDKLRSEFFEEKATALFAVKLEAPIPVPKQDVICLGENYAKHAMEGAKFRNESFDPEAHPSIYFSKRVNRAAADGELIDGHFDLDVQPDYESELAVIIRRDAYKVSRERSRDYVFGYTVLNDISARATQNKHRQWYRGKSFDGFTPMGPWIVTADEFAYPPVVQVQSRVNGELRQDSSTEDMLYDIPYIIEELSAGMTLKSGSIISTGTPSGVGLGFDPPKFLRPGDRVECTVSGIGTLSNILK